MRRPPTLVLLLFAAAGILFYCSLSASFSADTTPAPQLMNEHHELTPPLNIKDDTAALNRPEEDRERHDMQASSLPAQDAAHWLPPEAPTKPGASQKLISGCGPMPGPTASQTQRAHIPHAPCQAADPIMCTIAARAPDRSILLLVSMPGVAPKASDLEAQIRAARDAVQPGQLLLVAMDAAAATLAQSMNVGWYRPRTSGRGGIRAALAAQWRTASLLVRAGCTVVVSSAHVRWVASPFPHLSRDADVEAAQVGESMSRGAVVGVHDPPMGWSAYGQTMTVPLLNPSVVALQPTGPAAELASQMAHRVVDNTRSRARYDSLSMLLTRLVHQPAHDGDSRAGTSMRALRGSCFVGAKPSMFSSAVAYREGGGGGGDDIDLLIDGHPAGVSTGGSMGTGSNDILKSAEFAEARSTVMAHGCAARPRDEGAATPRPLNDLLGPHDVFPHPAACAEDENMVALCALLREAAIGREVLAAVSNRNIFAMLGTFLVGVARANITNAVVVALDDPTAEFAKSKGAHTYVRKLVARGGSTDNHATSGLKFAVLYEFIRAGCSVLLSDVDVLWVQNPFTLPSLYRDSDVEGMTDGWDDLTAYGYHYRPKSLRLSARNSGMFYVRATNETLRMMARLRTRMQREAVWDQTAYNEEMWWAAMPGEALHGVSARVMNYMCNLNSKVFFRYMREDAALFAKHRPVSLHVNYHPEKLPRMEDAFALYYGLGPDLGNGVGKPTKRAPHGGVHAWHWGVGLKAGKWCREAPRVRGAPNSALGARLVAAGGKASWAGIKGLQFDKSGALSTPWGAGTWGALKREGAPPDEDLLFADFIGQQHAVSLHPEGWPKLLSSRCADFENVTVTVL